MNPDDPAPARHAASAVAARAFRPTPLGRLQGWLGRAIVLAIARWLLRLRLDVRGLQHVPAGESLIVAAGPHRSWIDSFVLLMALPAEPRLWFLGSAAAMFGSWPRRAALRLAGGVVPVDTHGGLNRAALETSVAILVAGNRLAVFPEGWGQMDAAPDALEPFKRGVAFVSGHSGRRVIPAGLAGTQEVWRGKTLRVEFGSPLPALPPGAGRAAEAAWTAQLQAAVAAILPPLPPEPSDGRKPWPWLNDLLR
ncbi:MAG TPA: lysophospholipid acyltransferase family protein [Thermomicrobiales bacterium]|nr:lysophospholipid acyltransferase family protein [Thermomicrobiales bacterium]